MRFAYFLFDEYFPEYEKYIKKDSEIFRKILTGDKDENLAKKLDDTVKFQKISIAICLDKNNNHRITMDRKNFLKSALALPLLGNISLAITSNKSDKDNSTKDIPSWVFDEIEKARPRVDAWRKGRKCATFAVITDLHSGIGNRGTDFTDHILYANKIAEGLNADAILNLGDWGFEFPVRKEDDGMALLKTTLTKHAQTKIPTFFCIGNHDHYYKRFSNDFLGWYFPKFDCAVYSPSYDYGYVDYPEKECRMFFLNSSDGTAYGMGNKQIDFLKDKLESMPKSWTALVFTHRCFDELGELAGNKHRILYNEKKFRKTMIDFIDSGGKLAGNVTGDSHFDRTFNSEGINFFISQGRRACSKPRRPQGSIGVEFDPKTQTLVEIIMVDSKNREIKFVRVGAGGEARDRHAKF